LALRIHSSRLARLQFLGQFITPLVFAVLAVILSADDLGLAQQRPQSLGSRQNSGRLWRVSALNYAPQAPKSAPGKEQIEKNGLIDGSAHSYQGIRVALLLLCFCNLV
jgi:hypothetical protein